MQAVSSSLSQLHAKYGTTPKASNFYSVATPLVYANNPVQIAWDAIVENHFIPFPVDFYTNKTVSSQLSVFSRLTKPCRWPRAATLTAAYMVAHDRAPDGL